MATAWPSARDTDLQARCFYYLAYVVSHHGEFRRAMELTDRSRALYDRLDRPWDQAANWLFAARAAISAGDQPRSDEAADEVQHWLQTVDDPWFHVRGEAILGELARLQLRFDDAVLHLSRAAEQARQLGFKQTEASRPRTSARTMPDRRLRLRGSHLAARNRKGPGHRRRAAGRPRPRNMGGFCVRSARSPRARTALEAATAWHRDAGGGE